MAKVILRNISKRFGRTQLFRKFNLEVADGELLCLLGPSGSGKGEQGRGFAVVADEVRKLAERTIKATKEITGKIKAVQEDATSTMQSMQQASSEVTKANDFIHSVGESLGSIVDAVQRVRDQITQIATAVEEQSAVSDDVARNIERTSAIATEMERMSDNVMSEVNSLIAVAHQLAGAAGTIKVR